MSILHHIALPSILPYSMVQSPSWEASQETPRISQNPKVHYRTHKRPPPVSILSQPNPVHIPTSHLLEIHPNIIHPSTPTSPQWSPSLRFPHQDPIHPPSPHPYAPHVHPISFSIESINTVKVKVKVTLEQVTKAQRGSRGVALLFL